MQLPLEPFNDLDEALIYFMHDNAEHFNCFDDDVEALFYVVCRATAMYVRALDADFRKVGLLNMTLAALGENLDPTMGGSLD